MKTTKIIYAFVFLTILTSSISHGQGLWSSLGNFTIAGLARTNNSDCDYWKFSDNTSTNERHIYVEPVNGNFNGIRVGIGTNAPQRLLHMKGSDAMLRIDRTLPNGIGGGIALTSGTANTINKSFLIETHAAGPDNGWFMIKDWHQNVDGPNHDVRFLIDNHGKIGIGTMYPDRLLHVSGEEALLRLDRTNHQGLGGGIILTSRPGGNAIHKSFLMQVNSEGVDDGFLQIVDWSGNTRHAQGAKRRLTISDEGYLGIGSGNPQGKLDVQVNADHSFIVDEATFTQGNGTNSVPGSPYARMLLNTNPANAIPDVTAIIGGAVHISPRNEAPRSFGVEHLSNFLLWLEKGIVSEDIALVGVDTWADHVFEEGYELPALNDVENYIQKNGHLPDIPSSEEVFEKGYKIKELNVRFLEKIEELMLYTIAQEKELKELKESHATQIQTLTEKLEQLEASLIKD